MSGNADQEKKLAGEAAAALVEDGMDLGLGSGSTVEHFVRALGVRVADGLTLRGVATSTGTEALARSFGITIIDPADIEALDMAIDGADEVDGKYRMIKGGGAALLREKIVLNAAKRRVIIADSSKQVATLGKFPLPVEVVTYGYTLAAAAIAAMGCAVTLRQAGDKPLLTDNGNYVLDCAFGAIKDPEGLELKIQSIPGVVETGLFIGLLDELIIGEGDGVRRETAS